MDRNMNLNKIFRKLNTRKKKAYVFTKDSKRIKRNPCTLQAEEVQKSLERCNETVSSVCNNSEFSEVNEKALKCMKQVNCKWIPKHCNLFKDFKRIKTRSKKCLESYNSCMQIVKEEVPTIIGFCNI